MWLGKGPKRKNGRGDTKTFGIILLLVGAIVLLCSIGGFFVGTSGGHPYVNRAGQVGGRSPVQSGSPVFIGSGLVGLIILSAGIRKTTTPREKG